MGTKERQWTEAIGIKGEFKHVPGPGNYNVKPAIGDGPKYALRPKTAAQKPDGHPGPGQYEFELDKSRKMPSVVIGNEARKNPILVNVNQANPGPGQYTVGSTLDGRRSYT
jgi:hypothetical protein